MFISYWNYFVWEKSFNKIRISVAGMNELLERVRFSKTLRNGLVSKLKKSRFLTGSYFLKMINAIIFMTLFVEFYFNRIWIIFEECLILFWLMLNVMINVNIPWFSDFGFLIKHGLWAIEWSTSPTK